MAEDAFVGELDGDGAHIWHYDGTGVRTEVPHVVRDSPVGLSWGYAGNGPSDTALSILSVETGDAGQAEKYRQAFTQEVVAKLPLNRRFALSRDEVRGWLEKQGYDQRAVVERCRPQSDVGSEDTATHHVDDLDVQGARLAVRARSLDERERHLTEREARVDALAVVVGLAPEVPQAAWLEAEPLRRHLDALVVDNWR